MVESAGSGPYVPGMDQVSSLSFRVTPRAGAQVAEIAAREGKPGAELDWAEELIGAHFAVRNPQAVSACGCGTSFSVG
jgi:hypothetical protein